MKIISTDGASALQHPVHGAFSVCVDGTFDVPAELAVELLAFPFWTTEDAHLAAVERIDLHELHDPAHAAEVLAQLREERALLRAGATLEPSSTELAPWSADPRTVAWVGMHLRGDAAGIAELVALSTEIHTLQLRAQAAAESETAETPQGGTK